LGRDTAGKWRRWIAAHYAIAAVNEMKFDAGYSPILLASP